MEAPARQPDRAEPERTVRSAEERFGRRIDCAGEPNAERAASTGLGRGRGVREEASERTHSRGN